MLNDDIAKKKIKILKKLESTRQTRDMSNEIEITL